ncbi:amidase family protein [Marinomonas piezotolerans]|nr:amidase family protein [Marinomonas piezotolerans]
MDKNIEWQGRDLSKRLETLTHAMSNQDSVFIRRPFIDISGQQNGPLSGAIVSVKATFDVAGYPTTAGTQILGAQCAENDAEAVARLRAAGASIMGHTNMTELAYSGVGLNPHYGTPVNPLAPNCIPGGSTSGGAVSVATGLADIALGTDTGGSLRIPAAFCGLTGFKPSQASVPRSGCAPLSQSLDSVGVMANNVETCELGWQILASDWCSDQRDADLTIVVPENFGLDQLDDEIAKGFEEALERLKKHGIRIERQTLPLFDDYKTLPVWQFSAVESRRHYGPLFSLEDERLDPRVRQRIKRGESVSDQTFNDTCAQRAALIEHSQADYADTVFMMPTVACLAPKFEELESDEEFDRINLLCLRNTTFANVIDGCSISLPYQFNSHTMGIMLTAMNGKDRSLLALARAIQPLLAEASPCSND